MNPDNCTMQSAPWPTPPAKGALGTILTGPTLPNDKARATRRRKREERRRRA